MQLSILGHVCREEGLEILEDPSKEQEAGEDNSWSQKKFHTLKQCLGDLRWTKVVPKMFEYLQDLQGLFYKFTRFLFMEMPDSVLVPYSCWTFFF